MIDPSTSAIASRSQEIARAEKEFLFPCLMHYYQEPVVMMEGDGLRVLDADGREYLDFFSGILTTSLGHCHPRVRKAVAEQVAKLGHTSTLYVTEPQVEAARRLAAMAPGNLTKTFFTNSGTEAIETAIHLACIHTGRNEVIALRGSYHGRSTLATNLTGHASWRPLPSFIGNIKHTKAPYPYRCPFKTPCDESCAEAFAQDLEEVILTTTNGQPAAFLAETIQGVGGFIVPPAGYFQRVAEIIRRYGGLLIIDEVQTGFGRTGTWFGIEHWSVEPDIMVMAKGIAGGLPVGATMTTPEIASSWTGKTISTFGGNPISMAAMAETLDVMKEEDVPAIARERGVQLKSGLESLAAEYDWIGEIRGMGLMLGIELVKDRESKEPAPELATAFMEASKAEGLLLGKAGFRDQVIRLAPSLLVSEAEAADALQRIARAFARVDAGIDTP